MKTIFVLSLFLIVSACAPQQKPLTLNADYEPGKYRVAFLDVQPSQAILDSLDKSVSREAALREYEPIRKKFINIIIPKLVGKGAGPLIGVTVYINGARFKSLTNKMGVNSDVVLWNPDTKTEIGRMELNYRYSDPNQPVVGGLFEKTLATMLVNSVSDEDQEALVIEQYAGNLAYKLFPPIDSK